MALTRTQIMTSLSYLLGEQTVPTSNYNDRYAFIQNSVDEVYRLHAWPQAFATVTLTVTSYAATLASNYAPGGILDVREVVSSAKDDYVYTEIPYWESDDYDAGSYKFWLTGGSPNHVIETKEDASALTVRYQTKAPQIDDSTTIPFDDPMPFALGALRYMRIAENPEADITQEEDHFQVKVDQLIGQSLRNRPVGRIKSVAERSGWSTGDV